VTPTTNSPAVTTSRTAASRAAVRAVMGRAPAGSGQPPGQGPLARRRRSVAAARWRWLRPRPRPR
jgi:hypothetical protein